MRQAAAQIAAIRHQEEAALLFAEARQTSLPWALEAVDDKARQVEPAASQRAAQEQTMLQEAHRVQEEGATIKGLSIQVPTAHRIIRQVAAPDIMVVALVAKIKMVQAAPRYIPTCSPTRATQAQPVSRRIIRRLSM